MSWLLFKIHEHTIALVMKVTWAFWNVYVRLRVLPWPQIWRNEGWSVLCWKLSQLAMLKYWAGGASEHTNAIGRRKISWVQCGRVTNLKETNISWYNFIMIWISGSTGSSPEPWFEWFLELRPGCNHTRTGGFTYQNAQNLHPGKWEINEVIQVDMKYPQ